ncbi:hypothetical protein SAMN05216489_01888 [Streptomyces sp. 3213]|uniref:hypothetical protein n=1 Tax=Streptomyces sp. 3213.3 TaxID=1855348 RepID=UPI0008985577|nr:hypothetical protein [Streptomyces sp. 3213.3]SEC88920.1 hypothetical protein SAMN05216489_01888 [Streptomyces sp. 3213] [Streptomyces sp. 3213.3]
MDGNRTFAVVGWVIGFTSLVLLGTSVVGLVLPNSPAQILYVIDVGSTVFGLLTSFVLIWQRRRANSAPATTVTRFSRRSHAVGSGSISSVGRRNAITGADSDITAGGEADDK